MRSIAAALAAVLCLAAVGSGRAQVSGDVVRIGVINDMSGLYSDRDLIYCFSTLNHCKAF